MDEVVERLDEFAAELMAGWGPVGMCVALTDRERTLAIRPYGMANREAQIPVVEDTLFHIGSIGKSFTAFALMQDREAMRLNLQAPISQFVPWFDPPKKMRAITVHDLLTHTSGITLGTDAHREPVSEVWSIRRQDPGFSPGTQFWYSNAGFKLLGFVLERLAGQRYSEIIAERVFAPVGMTSSYAAVTDELRPYTAVGYRKPYRDRPPHGSDPWVPADTFTSESGDGSITSTAGDMAAYARMILGNGQVPGGKQVVNLESFDLMTQGYAEDPDEPGTFYGFGLANRDLDGRRIIEHWGTMVAHRAQMAVDPQAGLGIVVLATTGGIPGVGDYAMRMLRAAQEGAPMPEAPTTRTYDPPLDTSVDDFVGTFTSRGRTLRVKSDGVSLTADVDGVAFPLEYRGEGVFGAPNSPLGAFLLRAQRAGGATTGPVVAFTHGPDIWEGPISLPATAPRPEWASYAGTYRTFSPWVGSFHVVLRAGELFLIMPYDQPDPGESEEPLVPLPGEGAFRVGAEEWHPGRISFDTIVNGVAQHAILDGGSFDRAN